MQKVEAKFEVLEQKLEKGWLGLPDAVWRRLVLVGKLLFAGSVVISWTLILNSVLIRQLS